MKWHTTPPIGVLLPYNNKVNETPKKTTEMTSTRKNLRVTITGETFNDLELALEQVKNYVEDEYLSGFGSNETGSYEFDVTVGN